MILNATDVTINWDAVAAIGQCLGAIATFAAVIVAIYPPTWGKLDIKFIFSEDADCIPKLILYNKRNRDVLISKIQFCVKGIPVGEKEYLNDNIHYACADYEIVKVASVVTIDFSAFDLLRHDGHLISISQKNEDKHIYVHVIDTDNKRHKYRTPIQFKTYYELASRYSFDNLFSKVSE